MSNLAEAYPEDLLNFTPQEFVEFTVRLRGEPIDLSGRPWLKPIYDFPVTVQPDGTMRRQLLLIFGRQCEKSTSISNLFLSMANLIPYLRLLYVTASNEQMREFSDERLRTIIRDSDVLKKLAGQETGRVARGGREVQNVQTKRWLNSSKILLRSVFKSPDRVRGIMADILGVDELQDIWIDFLPVIEETLFTSSIPGGPVSIYSGTPKTFDNALEILWARHSTQNEWVVKCQGCGSWEVIEKANIGPLGLICKKCGKWLDPMLHGQWARFGSASREWEGFRVPQPVVIYTSRGDRLAFRRRWKKLLEKKKRYTEQKFQNEVMARSSDVGTKPVTYGEVRKCSLSYPMTYSPDNALKQSQTWAGLDWGCHDDQTEVLTQSGWKLFRDVQEGERVAQFDKDTREMDFTVPSRLTVKEHEGHLLHFTGKGVDMMLTPNHRMLVQRQRGPWCVMRADAVASRRGSQYFRGAVEWAGEEQETFTLPGLPVSPGYPGSDDRVFLMDDWLELLGYWLSEGGLCRDKFRSSCIKMSQRETVNPVDTEKIRSCMDRMGIPFSEFPNPKTGDVNWTIYGKQFWQWWQDNIGQRGHLKRIPRQFLGLSTRQLQILWDAMVLGDGSVDSREGNNNGSYTSTSRGLIQDFQELGVRLAYKTTSGLHKPAEGNRRAQYRCSFSEGRDTCLADAAEKNVEKVPYSGRVYCCSVPKEFIVTRRNGCVAFQGNTGDESFTVLSIWGYDQESRFKCYFAKKYEGVEADPDFAIIDIIKTLRRWNVTRIGADWGFGFFPNAKLMKAFGAKKVMTYYHSGKQKEKVKWDKKAYNFTTHRTRVLQDVFTLIKRGPKPTGICFPKWEQFEDFASDILSVYSEYSELRGEIVFNHPRGTPDDFLHTAVYALLVSQFDRRRPDLNAPGAGL